MPTRPLAELEAMVGDARVTVAEFRIEPGKVEEFARAITADDPVFRDGSVAADRGYDRVPAPLTYTQVGRFPRYTPTDVDGTGFDLGFQPEYVLHGEQTYEYERPVYVGDVLEGTTTLADVFQREGGRAGTMTFAVLETEYRTPDGDLVLTDRSTAIETERAVDDDESATGSGDGSSSNASAEPDGGTADPEPAAPTATVDAFDRVRTVDGLEPGDAGPTVVVPDLERQQFVMYAGASGDFNPIHYDEPYATAAGNESVFGQGMFTAGVTSRVVANWFDLRDVTSFGVRFQSRVFPDDTIVASGEVTEVDPDAGTVETALGARTTDGETLSLIHMYKRQLLLEGVPGVAKTTLANLFARASGLEYNRIQMTPDILPADITGTEIYRESGETFELQRGPVFANIVVADEINRATPKTQSALLEAMQERHVTIGGETLALPRPFMVIATQNPIEMEGVFELPEAQRDRFQFKHRIDLPDEDAELTLVDRFDDEPMLGPTAIEQVVDREEILTARERADGVHVARPVKQYLVDLAGATRAHPDVAHGASPRATLASLNGVKARAAIRGREYVIPDDVKALAEPVLAHRLVLTTDAGLSDVAAADVVADVIESVDVPVTEAAIEQEAASGGDGASPAE